MRKLPILVLASLLAITAMSPMVMADEIGFGVDVDKYITATFNYAAVDFGNLAANTTDTAALSVNNNVSVDTNYPYYVAASGTKFEGGSYEFAISNLKMMVASVFEDLVVGSATALGADPVNLEAATNGATSFHGFWLSIPAAQGGGAYTSTVTITYGSATV